jgi:predicted DCC family thiol-disulfide oxidoreductase YuxK
MNPNPPIENPLIFYDGVCGLCNRFVLFVLNRDRRSRFYFAPLQGKYAKEVIDISKKTGSELQTVYLFYNQHLYHRSRAVLKIFQLMGFPWNLTGIFRIIPPIIADNIYDFIAGNRYRWFGKHENCPIPNAEHRSRFIDF